jgi:succinoglycan biosynthesis transport protein ExoP
MTMPHDLVPTASSVPVAFRASSERPAPSPISQLLFVVFKWRRLILASAVVLTLAALVLALLKPPVRTASAKILFKQDRGAMQISGLSPQAARLPYSPQAIQSEVELFKSRSVLVPVARALLKVDQPSAAAVDAKVNSLRGNLLPAMIPETSIIHVTYSGRSNEEAEQTLGLIVRQYMDEHAAAFRDSPAVLAFYEKETSRAAADLHEAEEALAKWQAANGTVAIDPEITAQLDKLAMLERTLGQVEADIQGTQARLAALERLARGQPERAVMARERMPNPLIAKLQGDIANAEVALRDATNTPLVTKLKTDIVTAEVALEDLRKRYTDRERVVVEKKEQVAMLRQELAAAEREAVGIAQARLKQLRAELVAAQADADVPGRETVGPNPLREGLERDQVAARAQATALASQRDTLRQQIREASAALAPLRDKKGTAERLLRNIAVARDAFLTHSRRLEESRIAAGLDKQHLSDLAIVEHPHATGDSDTMKRVLIVLLAAVVGIGLGVAGAFAIEFVNDSVRTAEDVEFYLGLPVVATIPALPGAATRLAALPPVALRAGTRSERESESKGGPLS